ncbi:uncharacterized protein EI90DRAFT_2663349 [Cantharellus anzutake]|uniref:uncharacterized protein n=1 Tax=Cantharellus anzutake TaxID=1750568 RepID=UPI0019048BB5|nr:uncharacterized protein EI90DRAFT_2663349 [Cantharellus anzutake]KAF8337557.1 hypothetical protein EI90DRAFT_2663349 [Cantharellus anzutake]
MAAFILKRSLFYLCLLSVREGFARELSFATPARDSSQLFGTSSVKCQQDYDWANNSLGQSPCSVAAWLMGACEGWGTMDYLSPECEPYNSPMDNTGLPTSQCVCSSVVYNVIAACAGCQGEPYVTFTNYTANCSTSYITDGE